MLNGQIGYRIDTKKHYEIFLFDKNILDKKYIIDAGNSGDAIGLPTCIGGQRNLLGIMFTVGF